MTPQLRDALYELGLAKSMGASKERLQQLDDRVLYQHRRSLRPAHQRHQGARECERRLRQGAR